MRKVQLTPLRKYYTSNKRAKIKKTITNIDKNMEDKNSHTVMVRIQGYSLDQFGSFVSETFTYFTINTDRNITNMLIKNFMSMFIVAFILTASNRKQPNYPIRN